MRLACALALAGCASRAGTPDDRAATARGRARGAALAAQIDAEPSAGDPATVAALSAAILDGELDRSQLVRAILGSPDALAYANQVITDATAAEDRLRVRALPGALADAYTADEAPALVTLRAAPLDQLDVVYLQVEIEQHVEAQVVLAELARRVPDGELAGFIAELRAAAHRQRARAEMILRDY